MGYNIFNAPVPNVPATWYVSSFGISDSQGFGLHPRLIEYSSTRPFAMNLEMPTKCTIGEQIGLRVSIFNFMDAHIEVLVVLAKSPDYKFVHVEAQGVVSSYAPRTSYGEHQHLVFVSHCPVSSLRLHQTPILTPFIFLLFNRSVLKNPRSFTFQ